MSLRDILLALFVVCIWGSNFVAAKVSLNEIPPFLLMFLRFAATAAILLPFARVPHGKLWGIAVLSLVLGSVQVPLAFEGLRKIDAGTASVVSQLSVPIASVLAAMFFKDRLGWWRALGVTVAFGGVVVMAGEPRLADDLPHLLMLIVSALAFAVSNIQLKSIGSVDGLTMNAWMSVMIAPQLLILSLFLEEGHWAAVVKASGPAWMGLGYTVVMSTVVAYGLWCSLLGRYAVNQVVPFTLLIPAVSIVAGVSVLGEPLTWQLLVGGALTVLGVAITIFRHSAPSDAAEKAAA